ncbi:nischarin isoform X2 [Ambystoma mexicanum]|uniref:nischarin isoform X2 n=1 Tax=Ambystoma mexicanum TaxID=8296 RepID=UPI0037E7EC9D
MQAALFPADPGGQRKEVRVLGSELVESYTVYIIQVTVGSHQWTVKHRYSDFHELQEKLTAEKRIDRNLLPPKKIIGKNSKSLVEKRQKDLEVYLQTLLTTFPVAAPKVLSHFLHFHLYEIDGITAALAEELFHRGEQLLLAGEVFSIRPLQLFAVTQQLRQGRPTCATGDAKTDLGHVLDFTCRLKYLKITGTRGLVGTSNIEEHLLPFDLSVFKSLHHIEINDCDVEHIKGLTSSKQTLATLSARYSAMSMKDILVPEATEFDQWEPEGATLEYPLTAVIPKWKSLTTLDMSHNRISHIDDSVRLTPKIEFLDLSHNEILQIENLQHLYNLIHLDLSYNKLAALEGAHTRLGNIKTLNLAGNLLESLTGLSKLYSLVTLDLSNNKIQQIDEIKNIGSLPCLEKVSLTNNPLTIFPDYRTKVLAQFWDRASEVCLDNTITTEKELDTVEVLKAIQKAKECKNKLNSSSRKNGEDPRLSATSSKTSCSSLTVRRPSSPSLPCPVSSSQVITCSAAALATSVSFPSSSAPTQDAVAPGCCEGIESESGRKGEQATSDLPKENETPCQESVVKADPSAPYDHPDTIILPFSCMSYTATNQELISHLSASIAQASMPPAPPPLTEDGQNLGGDTGATNPGDGYFEMGLPEGGQTVEWNNASDADAGRVHVVRVLWCFAIQVQKVLRQFASCLVLTEDSIAVFEIPRQESERSHHLVIAALKLVLCFPYVDLTEFGFLMPEVCLTLEVRHGQSCFFVLSESHNLQDFYCCLQLHSSQTYADLRSIPKLYGCKTSLQEFVYQLMGTPHTAANGCEIKGCFPVYLYPSSPAAVQKQVPNNPLWTKQAMPSACPTSGDSSNLNTCTFLPCWVFLTTQHLHILKIDFGTLLQKLEIRDDLRNAFKVSQIPLASVLLHPPRLSTQMKDSFTDGHMLRLLLGYTFMAAVFVLPHEKFHFVRIYSLLRSFLQDVKTIVIFKSSESMTNNLSEAGNEALQLFSFSKPHLTLSSSYPSEAGLQKLTEENHVPFYLPISASLLYVAGLKGSAIVEFFHDSVAEVENEELRHLMWSSVVFYKTPDVEVTACVLLSTKALYFLLDDRVALFNEHQLGPAAGHIVTCLTRDSYCTHAFLQHLMSVLSLLARTPSPEPAEKDFYSEFGTKNTGKMENYELVHSSRVKFTYPNEEEIGDLTFIVTEKMDCLAKHQPLNILLYVLAFQVAPLDGTTQASACLQPKTLLLTSSGLFLFNEDYISYPLPEFAKEPPKKDKYQFMDGRRIRDLDRVLMGYQTYPQALTFVFDDVQNQDLMQSLTLNHFGEALPSQQRTPRDYRAVDREVQWCIFIPSADCRERLISLLARQWEILCGRELPLELTG